MSDLPLIQRVQLENLVFARENLAKSHNIAPNLALFEAFAGGFQFTAALRPLERLFYRQSKAFFWPVLLIDKNKHML